MERFIRLNVHCLKGKMLKEPKHVAKAEAKDLAKKLGALFIQVEEHKKDAEYVKALDEADRHLSHK